MTPPIPSLAEPFVDRRGLMTPAWANYFQQLSDAVITSEDFRTVKFLNDEAEYLALTDPEETTLYIW